MNHMQRAKLAKDIICSQLYTTISTCSVEGPWISPVFTAFDNEYNFYWRSRKDALHSQYINQSNQVAMVIFNSMAPFGEGRGVYIQAQATECHDEAEILKASKLLAQRSDKEPQPVDLYQGKSFKRMYKATPVKAWLNAVNLVEGEIFDERIELEMSSLRSA